MSDYKEVFIAGPLTAFGEVSVAEETPAIQIDATQGLKTQQEVEVFTGTTGTATAPYVETGHVFECTTGTDVGGYGLIRSQRAIKYRPGQGIVIKFTARFDTPVALSTQRAGGVTLGNELTFGYDGVDFGVLIRNSGAPEMRRLTITAAATGNETATITLNGTAFTVDLTSGTIKHNIVEIAADTFLGWNATGNDVTVLFLAASVDAKSGTYSFSSTGTATGTFEQVAAGRSVNDTWVKQTEWNVNRCDGAGSEPFVLDHSKGNVYGISMQYLGYGNIDFTIENPSDGKPLLVHRYQFANSSNSPSLSQPDFKIGLFAASLGSTTDLTIRGASFYAANQGKTLQLLNPDAHSNTQSGVGTTSTNVLSIRNRLEINSVINLKDLIGKMVSIAADGTKPALFNLYLNPTFTGDPDWQYHEGNTTDSLVEIMNTAVTVSVNQGVTIELGAFGTARTGGYVIDLPEVIIKRGDVLTLAGNATSGTTDLVASIIWNEF